MTYLHHIHLLEGEVLEDDTFIANVVDEYAWFSAERLYEVMKAASKTQLIKTPLEVIKECLDAGCDTLVVLHRPDGTAGMHFIKADRDLFRHAVIDQCATLQ